MASGVNNDVLNTLFFLLVTSLILFWDDQWRFVSAVKNVTQLPGFDGPLPFSLETGYEEVDEERGVELFYYFVKSERSPEEDPLILWLAGGPGCSGLFALVYEIGPLRYDVEGYIDGLPSLVYNPYTWTKVSNIIFVDSPVGTGFSYSRTKEGYVTSDTEAIQKILIFLSKWLDVHPEFKTNPLYIGGDSYSGKIIPAVALEIALGYLPGDGPPLDLKGYLAGNPITGNNEPWWKIAFAHRMELISDELYESLIKNCQGNFTSPKNVQCANDLQTYKKCTDDINIQNILEPMCPGAGPREIRARKMIERKHEDGDGDLSSLSLGMTRRCTIDGYPLSEIWANNETVREALGVHKGTTQTWLRCNHGISYTEYIETSVPYHRTMTSLNGGYRALIYSGDHDFGVPTIGTQDWIRSLNSSIMDDWRPWYLDNQIVGYTRTYSNNLTFVTVKDAGHTAPEYKAKECQVLFEKWLSNVSL